MSKDQVYEALLNSEEPLKAGQVAEITGLDKADVDKSFKELKKEGRIESPKRCFYSAVK